MCKEIWKPIIGFEGLYEVSDRGRIKRVKGFRACKDRILKPYANHRGYLLIGLYKNSCVVGKQIHRLVLEAFIESCPEQKECNHKNGIKTDNRLENLEWVTHSQNEKHKYNTLGYIGPRGERQGNSKLTTIEVLAIRQLCKRGYNQSRIAEWFNVTRGTINDIYNGKRWKHIECGISNKNEYGNSKLTKAQITIIRKLYKNKKQTCKELSQTFNVNQKTINNIINYKTWRTIQ